MLLIKTVLVLCSATVALAARAVVSGAVFEGMDTTDPSAEGAIIFENPENHAAAAASILTYAASTANFRPAERSAKALSSSLEEFMKKTCSFEGFMAKSETNRKLRLDGSFTQLEQAIRDEIDDPLTARGLRDLIPGYIQDKSLKDWTMSLVVLSKPEDSNKVNIKLARVSLTICKGKSDTAYIPKQTASLVVYNLQVIPSVLIANANKFAEVMPIYKVHDFIDFFASPKVPEDNDEEEIFGESVTCSTRRQQQAHRQNVLSW